MCLSRSPQWEMRSQILFWAWCSYVRVFGGAEGERRQQPPHLQGSEAIPSFIWQICHLRSSADSLADKRVRDVDLGGEEHPGMASVADC